MAHETLVGETLTRPGSTGALRRLRAGIKRALPRRGRSDPDAARDLGRGPRRERLIADARLGGSSDPREARGGDRLAHSRASHPLAGAADGGGARAAGVARAARG